MSDDSSRKNADVQGCASAASDLKIKFLAPRRGWSDLVVDECSPFFITPPVTTPPPKVSSDLLTTIQESYRKMLESHKVTCAHPLGVVSTHADDHSGIVKITSGGDPVPTQKYGGFVQAVSLGLELLLNDEKFTDQGPVYRVRAAQDIVLDGVCSLDPTQERNIPAGRLGGYISKDTRIIGDKVWIGLGATVTKSTLEDAFLNDGSYHGSFLVGCSLSGIHTVTDSFLKEVYSPQISDSYTTILLDACLKTSIVQPGARIEGDTFVGMNIPRICIGPKTPHLFATMPSFMRDWKGLPGLNHGVWIGSPSKISMLEAYVPHVRGWTTGPLHTIQAKLSGMIKSSSQGRMIDAFFTELGKNILDLD